MQQRSSQIFIGVFFIGIALGLLIKKPAVGTLLGLGVGFLAKYYMDTKEKEE